MPPAVAAGSSCASSRRWVTAASIVTSDANHLGRGADAAPAACCTSSATASRCYWLRTFKAATAKSWQRIVSWLHFEWRLLRLDTSRAPAARRGHRVQPVAAHGAQRAACSSGATACPLVFEVRDIWPLTLVEEGGFSRAEPARPRARARSSGSATAAPTSIVGTMPAWIDHVREVLGESARCTASRWATPSRPSTPTPTAAPPPADASAPGSLVVGYAGTIGITNALEVLLRRGAAAARRAGHPVPRHR